jgi:protein-S-isoprenylcysteine O-methyltransferase Ste14
MTGDDSTFLSSEQVSTADRESTLYRVAARCRKVSQYFGWPMLVALMFAPVNPDLDYNYVYYFFLAVPIGLSSLVLRLMSQGFDRNQYLVVNGPYRYIRNPVELGALLGYTAAATALALPAWYTLSLLTLSLLYMSFVSIAYERDLKRRYGSHYVKYARRVRRWFPLELPATNPEMQDYSFHLALVNERNAGLWLLGYILVFSLRQHFLK